MPDTKLAPNDLVKRLREDAQIMRAKPGFPTIADEIVEAADEIERRSWHPIKTAPKNQELLLCYQADGKSHLTAKYGVGLYSDGLREVDGKVETHGRILWNWEWVMTPTHWMPLQPPEE